MLADRIRFFVMAGLVPAIHDFPSRQDVDARHEAGHDEVKRDES